MDFRRWAEGGWRQREELFDRTIELRCNREKAVIARAGFSRDPVSHFALHHENRAIEHRVIGGEFEQDGRGDVGGQIADDKKALAGLRSGFGEAKAEDVFVDDGDAIWREFRLELGCKLGVELDGEHMSCVSGEDASQRATAGTDFDNGMAGAVAESRNDALD